MRPPMREGLPIDTYDELDRLRELTPARVLRSLAVLRARMESPGSTSGLVADRLRDGLATREPYQGGGGDVQRAELAWLLGLTRDLTDLERRACAVRYSGTGELVEYEAIRSGAPTEGDGELPLPSPAQVDYEGKELTDPWVRVRGYRERMPSFEEVGRALGLTPRQAQRHLEAARDKIQAALDWRLLMAEQQSRYE